MSPVLACEGLRCRARAVSPDLTRTNPATRERACSATDARATRSGFWFSHSTYQASETFRIREEEMKSLSLSTVLSTGYQDRSGGRSPTLQQVSIQRIRGEPDTSGATSRIIFFLKLLRVLSRYGVAKARTPCGVLTHHGSPSPQVIHRQGVTS